MRTDQISRIEIDQASKLCVWPTDEKFQMIYRSAMEAHWDETRHCLFGPKPREWTYLDWFKKIIAAANDEYGINLILSAETQWHNVEPALRADIESFQAYRT